MNSNVAVTKSDSNANALISQKAAGVAVSKAPKVRDLAQIKRSSESPAPAAKQLTIVRLHITELPATTLHIRRTASSETRQAVFHEPGHFMASMFFAWRAERMNRLSVISGERLQSYGRMTMRTDLDRLVSTKPKSVVRRECLLRMICGLSGPVAESMLLPPDERWESLVDTYDADGCPLSDQLAAQNLADALVKLESGPGANEDQVHELSGDVIHAATLIAYDIFKIPAVWQTVEQLAARLAQCGRIELSALHAVCKDIYGQGTDHPDWRKRIDDLCAWPGVLGGSGFGVHRQGATLSKLDKSEQ